MTAWLRGALLPRALLHARAGSSPTFADQLKANPHCPLQGGQAVPLNARLWPGRAAGGRYRRSRARRDPLEPFATVSYSGSYHEPKTPCSRHTSLLVCRRLTCGSGYDDAARQALIVLWEASDRICGKRLKPLLCILLPALERHGHLKLDETIRSKVLAMSAATIDRLLRAPRKATRNKKPRRIMPEIRRRVTVRTFADWNDPPQAAWKWILSRTVAR
jgi:hypothetical protein